MSDQKLFVLMDRSQEWYADIIANHLEEAQKVVDGILSEVEENRDGCLVTPTKGPRKVRFLGHQDRAYRFVFCI
ncbi:hypothetical protein, partial [Shimia sagamensis]